MKSIVRPAGPSNVHWQLMKLIPCSETGAVALNTISQSVNVQLRYSLPSRTTVSLLNAAPSCRAMDIPLDRHVRPTSYGTPGNGCQISPSVPPVRQHADDGPIPWDRTV